MTCGVRKIPIGALAPDINNALLIGVIISKQNLRIFPSKKDSEERGVWNFTLRDSPTDTINGSYWGSAEGMKTCHEMFTVGDVVEIRNPRITFKQPGTTEAQYSPNVSSPFQLQLQEFNSEMLPHMEEDTERIQSLQHIPTKLPGDFLRLSDVQCYGQAMKGQSVNLLVALCSLGEVRTVKSRKDARDMLCRDMVVMDQSLMEFHITLWNETGIRQSESWRPRDTILLFADMRLDWSSFRKGITASVTSCTIITENPCTAEAAALRNYAKTVPVQPVAILDHLASTIVDPSSISAVMTTAQVLDKAYSGGTENQFTALLYVMVTHLDLDGPDPVTNTKCCRCSQLVDANTGKCLNVECPVGSGVEFAPPLVIFNLRVSLTDHRGTLQNCRLVSPAAEKVFGCSVNQYLKMSVEERTKLKWRLLLSRCEARVLILCASPQRPRPLISLLTCSPASPTDVSCKLPIY